MTPRQVPVMRATFTKFDDRDSVLVFLVHHSASDAWSQNVILRDLAAFYDARANHHPVDLAPVKQYQDYAEWQKAGTADTSDARQYWREKLRGAHVLALPNDRGGERGEAGVAAGPSRLGGLARHHSPGRAGRDQARQPEAGDAPGVLVIGHRTVQGAGAKLLVVSAPGCLARCWPAPVTGHFWAPAAARWCAGAG
jgi:Condensation domain